MKHTLNYDRIDLIFDQYLKKCLREETRSGRGEGSQYLFEIGQLLLLHQIDNTRTWVIFFLLCPSFILLLDVILLLVTNGKGKRKAYDVWVKSERRDDFFDDFVELGEKPSDVTSDHIDMLNSFVLQLYGLRQNTLSAA